MRGAAPVDEQLLQRHLLPVLVHLFELIGKNFRQRGVPADEFLLDQHRRDRDRNRNSGYSTIYQKAEFDTNGVQRDWSGDERSDSDDAGQGGDNVSG